jgi:tripartite-type tricarboxylate transporter receptor subunit TctC
MEYIKSNRVRALGVASTERQKLLPNVPPIADTVPGFEASTWVSLFAPAGTPKAIIDRLNAELGKALRDPAVASKLSGLTYDPVHGSPEQMAQRLKVDYEKIGKLFREYGVKLD